MAASWRLTACDVRKNPRSNTDPRMQRNYLGLTITFQRTVTTPLALCLSARVHSISEPLHVHRVCGQVLLKGSSLPGTLRLRARDGKGGAKPFEQIGKTNDEGQFDFKDLPAG